MRDWYDQLRLTTLRAFVLGLICGALLMACVIVGAWVVLSSLR